MLRHVSILLLLLLGTPAFAGAFPWTQISRDDLAVIPNSRVEHAIRLALVDSAKETLDIAIYDLRDDNAFAMPLLKKIRLAADRGVRVRFVTSWVGQYLVDPFQHSARYLTEPPCRQPIEFLIYGGPELQGHGWNLTDGMHEKLLIVDGIRLMVTGRGFGNFYRDWIDTAYLMKGPLLRQAKDSFEWIWSAYRKEKGLFHRTPTWFSSGRDTVPNFKPDLAPVALNAAEQKRVEWLKHWLRQPASTPAERTVPARILHHDFVRQMRALPHKPSSYSYDERVRELHDPVIDAVVAKLARARDVRINTLSMILHPKLKAALLAALGRGARVRLFTDGPAAIRAVAPVALPWAAGLPDLDDLLAAGAEAHKFEARPEQPFIYLHRKLAVLDDTVFFGSHNLNLPSTVANGEISFEVVDQELAQELAALHDQAVERNGVRLSPEQIHRERLSTRISQWFAGPLMGFF